MARRRRPPRPGALADHAPLRILRKILLLQSSYYTCAAVLIVFTVLVAGKELKLDLVLSWRTIRPDTTVGWMLALVWLLNSLIRYEAAERSSRFTTLPRFGPNFSSASSSYSSLLFDPSSSPTLRLRSTLSIWLSRRSTHILSQHHGFGGRFRQQVLR